jgi:hypothetical protein
MREDEYDPLIILGRPFLNTIKAIIYIGSGEVHFHSPSQKVCRYFNNNYIIEGNAKKNRSRRKHHNQKNQTPKDGWADYEREVSRYEDRYPKEEISPKGDADAPIESVPVTMEKKEQAPPSGSTPPTK